MYTVLFSSVIGGVGLLIAILLRSRSYKQGAERMKNSIMKTMPEVPKDQIEEVFEAIVAENKE